MKRGENKPNLDNRNIHSAEKIWVSPQEHNLLLAYRDLSDESKLTMDILCKRLLEHEKGREKID